MEDDTFPISHSCPVCFCPIRVSGFSMNSGCRHLVCVVCLKQCSSCPICRDTIFYIETDKFLIYDSIVKSFEDQNIIVECTVCKKKLNFLYFVRHKCPEQICFCIKCGKKEKRKNAKEHRIICKYRLIKCGFCHSDIPFNKLRSHKINCYIRKNYIKLFFCLVILIFTIINIFKALNKN